MRTYLSPTAAENLDITRRCLPRAHRTGFISPDSIDALGAQLPNAKQLVIPHTAKVAMITLHAGSSA